jgi:hypothetical protein
MSQWQFAAAVCLVVAGCRSGGTNDARQIYVVAIQYRLQKQPIDVTVYVSVDDRDPPDDILIRLRREWPNLKPASQEPEKDGFLITIKSFKWIDKNTAELRMHGRYNSKIAPDHDFADYRVVRRGEQWVVDKVSNITMS